MGQDTQQFMTTKDHFDRLVDLMPKAQRDLYHSLVHARPESCFRNRSFVVYEFRDRKPVQLDHLKVMDFVCNDSAGASCVVRSDDTGKEVVVGYQPTQLFHYPVFLYIPLHVKARWSTVPSNPLHGSLAFDVVVRTKSRFNLQERGVIYCETGVSYAKEFEGFKR